MTQIPTRAQQTASPPPFGEAGGKRRRIPYRAVLARVLRAVAPEPALAPPASELEAERRQTRVRLAGAILILAYLGVRYPHLDPVAGYPVWLAVFFAFIVWSLTAYRRARVRLRL